MAQHNTEPAMNCDLLWPRQRLVGHVSSVARKLLGAVLVSHTPLGTVSGRIMEVEAYDQSDPASHSFRGITPRTTPMFGPAGHAYIYRSYGIHLCLNITTGAKGHGAAVLVRALQPLSGQQVMATLRSLDALWLAHKSREGANQRLCRGPGNVAQALGLHLMQTGEDLLAPAAPLQLHRGTAVPQAQVASGGRIGISVAKDVPWRFFVAGSPYVSASRRA